MVVHGYVKEIETEAGAALRAAVGLRRSQAGCRSCRHPAGLRPSFLMSR